MSGLKFPPTDLVTLSVKFPKVGYAQIRSQDFPVPYLWKGIIPSTIDSKASIQTNVGMKLTSGFEMLLSDPQHQDKQTVREMKMLLEDLETGDETMPSDADIAKLEKREDDEKWLDINFDDLEHELGGKEKRADDGKKREFGDKAAQENLQRIVKQFEEFLNDDSGGPREDGAFNDSSDLEDDDDGLDEDESDEGEDKDASFDEEEFTKMMQEMMGMPPDVMKEIMSGNIDALSEGRPDNVPPEIHERAKARVQEIDSSEEEEDIEDMKQMERELRASGALDLSPGRQKHRLSRRPHSADQGDETDENQSEVDFDGDFARNILQSFRSSGGRGGPAANLMSMMNESASTPASGSSTGTHRP